MIDVTLASLDIGSSVARAVRFEPRVLVAVGSGPWGDVVDWQYKGAESGGARRVPGFGMMSRRHD